MAKKKKRKETKKASSNYSVELTGVVLIAIAIIGICQFGIVGNFLSGFASFLVGTAYSVLLVCVFIVGVYMIVKREKPDFFTSKLVGVYIFSLALLILLHANYMKNLDLQGFEVVKETIDNLMGAINGVEKIQGGGIIGAVLSVLFVKLFTINGTRVVCIVLFICGVVMFTGMSLYEMFTKGKNKIKEVIKHNEKVKDRADIKIAEDNYEKDNKVVISSMDELIHTTENVNNVNNEEKNKDGVPSLDIIEPKSKEETVTINSGYKFPPISLLKMPPRKKNDENKAAIKDNVGILEEVFHDFGIEGKVVAANVGPAVTQYEMEVKAGTKVSKILGINREIALATAAKDVRIQAPIPGKRTIGIEIPNKTISMVTVREILETIPKSMDDSKLLVTLGKNIMGKPIYCEINKTPHLLVAGSTGSGK